MTSKPSRDGLYHIKTLDEGYYMTLAQNGTVLLEGYSYNNPKLTWKISASSAPNTYKIQNGSNNACLTYTEDGEFADAEDGYLICQAGSNTTWVLKDKGSYSQIGVYGVKASDDAAGKVVDSCFPDKILHFWPPGDTNKRQHFIFEPQDGSNNNNNSNNSNNSANQNTNNNTPINTGATNNFDDGRYVIRNVSNRNMIIDLADGNTNAGNPLIVWPAHYGNNQKWDVKKQSDGTYTIGSVFNGNAFVGYVRDKLSRPVCVAGPAPWKLIPVQGTDDTFLISTPGGFVIDLKEDGSASGQNRWLALHTLQGDITQQWQFEDTL